MIYGGMSCLLLPPRNLPKLMGRYAIKYSTSVDDYTPYLNSLKALLISTIANSTDGVTGNISLNVVGDRAYATYDFWGIQHQAEQYNWETVARYNNETETLERF